jgi:hypothetical protein
MPTGDIVDKASYAEAGCVFLKLAKEFAPTLTSRRMKNRADRAEILRLHKEFLLRVDEALRPLSWTCEEWRNYNPTPQEREAYNHEINMMWPESSN